MALLALVRIVTCLCLREMRKVVVFMLTLATTTLKDRKILLELCALMINRITLNYVMSPSQGKP